MDPLSITTATLSLIATVSTSAKFIRTVRGFPKEAEKVGEEISDLERVVFEVAKALKVREKSNQSVGGSGEATITEQQERKHDHDRDTRGLLLKAQSILRQLVEIFDQKLTVPDDQGGTSKISRKAWLRHRSKVNELRLELSGVKSSLTTVVGAATLSDVKEILLRLDGLVVVERGSLASKSGAEAVSYTGSQNGSLDREDATSLTSANTIDTTDCDSYETALSEKGPSAQLKQSLPGIALRAQGRSNPSLSIQSSLISVRNPRTCPPFCSCVCHRPITLSSPSALSQLLGTLFISSRGTLLPYSYPPPCTERLCRPQRDSKRTLTYRFPQWLVSKAVTVALTSSLSGGPQLQLHTLQVRPASADVFRLISAGDLLGLQSLFSKGQAGIYDIDDRGWTTLHKAFILDQSSIMSFLLDAGADISLAADNGSSVMERVWYYDRTSAVSPGQLASVHNRILKATDLEELATSQQYTVLHKIVLGLAPGLDLATQLQTSTSLIDVPDSRGRTPLWWASARGDTSAVKLLLDFGASAYVRAQDQHGPLHVAKNPGTARLLLDAGIDVDMRDGSGRTALHCCSYRGPGRGGSISLLRTLLDSGADIDAQTIHKNTPLHFAAMYSCIEHIEELICRGANIELLRLPKDLYFDGRFSKFPFPIKTISDAGAYGIYDGTTPLSTAVQFAQAASVRVLLRHGANVTTKTKKGLTILHLAAMKGNVATIEALAEARLKGLDARSQDSAGLTAQDYLEERIDINLSLRRAFKKLVASLQHDGLPDENNVLEHNGTDSASEESDADSESFEDARQNWLDDDA